jgi:hypothetical protein
MILQLSQPTKEEVAALAITMADIATKQVVAVLKSTMDDILSGAWQT